MEIEESFKQALITVDTLTKKPSNSQLLKLYALYKQATEGDNNNDRPGGFDFKAIAKHNAWLEEKGRSAEEVMGEYTNLINGLKAAES